MSFLDDLSRQEQTVRTRVDQRRKTATSGGLEEQQYLADQDRGTMMAKLRAIASDPRYGQSLTDAGNKQMTAAKQTADLAAGQAKATTLSRAASRGLLGSSVQREGMANIQAQRDGAVDQAATLVSDWKTNGLRGQDQTLYEYLNKILQPDPTVAAAQDATLQGQQFDWDIQQQLGANEEQYRAGLSQALGSFLSNGIAPGIQSGFRKADTYNQQQARLNPYGGEQNKTFIPFWSN